MFKIDTEQELYNFLKILSEESVKKSRNILKEEEDPYNSFYLKKRKQEKNMFEQDVEVESGDDPEPEQESEPEELEDTEDPPESKEPQEAEGSDSSEEKFVASKDRLVDFVNDIRSAPSIKDSAVNDQINDYYDRLTQEEKDVLVFFLRELSRVMTGKASGRNARDPSDPPLSIKFVTQDEESPGSEDSEAQAPAEDPSPEDLQADSIEQPETPEGEEEDTSAPIKVNESQDHRYLRAKIKNLLR